MRANFIENQTLRANLEGIDLPNQYFIINKYIGLSILFYIIYYLKNSKNKINESISIHYVQ